MATNSRAIRTRVKPMKKRVSGKVEVETRIVKGEEEEIVSRYSRTINDEVNHPNPGFVSVGGGITKNLGDFNSAKISVTVSLPCFPTIAGAKAKYEDVSDLVDDLMEKENKKVMK